MKVEVKALSDFVHCKYSFVKGQSEDLPLSVATDLKAAGLVSFQSMVEADAEAVAAEAAAAEVAAAAEAVAAEVAAAEAAAAEVAAAEAVAAEAVAAEVGKSSRSSKVK